MLLTEIPDSGSQKGAPAEITPQPDILEAQSKLVRSKYNSLKCTFQRRAEQALSHLSNLGIMSKWRSRKLPLFPQFTKLPQELQIEIWKFAAILPRLNKFKATVELLGKRGVLKVININGHNPLLPTSILSRQIALATAGSHYSIGYYRAWDYHLLSPAYSICFDPGRDIISVPDMSTLVSLAWWYNICANDQQNSRARVTVVKSLAIAGVVLPAKTPQISEYDLGSLQWTGAGPSFFNSIMRYTGLEELIFVQPTMEGDTLRNRSAVAEAQYKQRIEDSLKYMSWLLKANVQGAVQKNQLADQQIFGTQVPIVLSKWWFDPKITMMSKEQVKARFG
jgi:hypothetical protein